MYPSEAQYNPPPTPFTLLTHTHTQKNTLEISKNNHVTFNITSLWIHMSNIQLFHQLTSQGAGYGVSRNRPFHKLCVMHDKRLTWGHAWCNDQHVCFHSLPPFLQCGFQSQLALEFSGFIMWHFLKLVVRGFLRVLWFPPHLHWLTFNFLVAVVLAAVAQS